MTNRIAALLHTPAHSQIAGALPYLSQDAMAAGTRTSVPLGQRELLGVVCVE